MTELNKATGHSRTLPVDVGRGPDVSNAERLDAREPPGVGRLLRRSLSAWRSGRNAKDERAWTPRSNAEQLAGEASNVGRNGNTPGRIARWGAVMGMSLVLLPACGGPGEDPAVLEAPPPTPAVVAPLEMPERVQVAEVEEEPVVEKGLSAEDLVYLKRQFPSVSAVAAEEAVLELDVSAESHRHLLTVYGTLASHDLEAAFPATLELAEQLSTRPSAVANAQVVWAQHGDDRDVTAFLAALEAAERPVADASPALARTFAQGAGAGVSDWRVASDATGLALSELVSRWHPDVAPEDFVYDAWRAPSSEGADRDTYRWMYEGMLGKLPALDEVEPVPVDHVVGTSGHRVERLSSSEFRIGGTNRSETPSWLSDRYGDVTEVALRFTYGGESKSPTRLASGIARYQVGFKIRTDNTCNVAYLLWKAKDSDKDAPPSLNVSLKHNPGLSTHAQCGANGYQTADGVAIGGLPKLEKGAEHELRVRLHGTRYFAFADGEAAGVGDFGPGMEQFSTATGIRIDNLVIDGTFYAR